MSQFHLQYSIDFIRFRLGPHFIETCYNSDSVRMTTSMTIAGILISDWLILLEVAILAKLHHTQIATFSEVGPLDTSLSFAFRQVCFCTGFKVNIAQCSPNNF